MQSLQTWTNHQLPYLILLLTDFANLFPMMLTTLTMMRYMGPGSRSKCQRTQAVSFPALCTDTMGGGSSWSWPSCAPSIGTADTTPDISSLTGTTCWEPWSTCKWASSWTSITADFFFLLDLRLPARMNTVAWQLKSWQWNGGLSGQYWSF